MNVLFKQLLISFRNYISKSSNRTQVFLVVLFIVAIAYVINQSQHSCLLTNVWCGQDMDQYFDYSNSLLAGKGYSTYKVRNIYFIDLEEKVNYIPEILRLPSYSLMLTSARLLYDSPPVILFLNILFYLGLLIYSILLIRKIIPNILGSIVFAIIAFNPVSIFYTSFFSSVDMLVAFTLVGFVYHAISIFTNRYIFWHTISAILFGVLCALSRQNTLLFIYPLLTSALLIEFIVIRKILKNYLLIIIFITLALSVWIFRNYMIIGKISISEYSNMQLFAEYIYFTPYQTEETTALVSWLFTNNGGINYIKNERKKGKSIPEAYSSLNSYVGGLIYRNMRDDPYRIIKHYIKGFESFFVGNTFLLENNKFINLLKNLYMHINKFIMHFMLIFPLLSIVAWRMRIKIDTLIYILWFASFTFIVISAFAHGIIIGNRGVLPVFSIITIILGYSTLIIIKQLILYYNKQKTISIRFDIDSVRCLIEEVPRLLNLADNHNVKFTFFVNMGRAIWLPAHIKRRNETNVKALSAYKKLGIYHYVRTAFFKSTCGKWTYRYSKRD